MNIIRNYKLHKLGIKLEGSHLEILKFLDESFSNLKFMNNKGKVLFVNVDEDVILYEQRTGEFYIHGIIWTTIQNYLNIKIARLSTEIGTITIRKIIQFFIKEYLKVEIDYYNNIFYFEKGFLKDGNIIIKKAED